MPTTKLDNFADWLRASVSRGVQINNDGSVELARTNRFPNQHLQVIGEDGEPVAYDLSGMPEKLVAYGVLLTQKGAKPSTLSRQTTSHLPLTTDAWDANQPIVPGAPALGKSGPKPSPPQVSVEEDPTRGFDGGRYGYAFALGRRGGKPTPVSGEVFFDVGNSQSIPCPLPSQTNGADLIYLYLRRPGGANLARQRPVDIERLRGRTTFELQGPYVDGPPPAAVNDSGLSRPQTPRVTGPARFRDVVQEPSRFDLWAARYRFALQLEDERSGETLLSVASPEIVVEGDTVREKIRVAVEETAEGQPDPRFAGADPRKIRPSGKLSENEYLGEEVDFEESRLVGLLNESRRAAGVPDLVLSQVMNRTAYNQALGEGWSALRRAREEGYEGEEITTRLLPREDGGADALVPLLGDPIDGRYLSSDPSLRSVGVAREQNADGTWAWCLVAGEPIGELPDGNAPMRCIFVDEDGNEHEYGENLPDDARIGVFLSWSLVRNGRMHYSYGGSYGQNVSAAASRWHALGRVSVRSGGSECAITDGALSSANAVTYSDGRIVLDAQNFAGGNTNTRNKVCVHEFGHALGFAHTAADFASVMEPGTNMSGETNANEFLTQYDKDEYARKYGTAPAEPTPTEPTPSPGTIVVAPGATNTTPGTVVNKTSGTTENPVAPSPPAPRLETPGTPESPQGPRFRYEYRTKVLPVKKGVCFAWRVPKIVRNTPGVRAKYWVQINDAWHRAYLKRSSTGKDTSFRSGTKIHGYPPDEEPGGMQIGLVQEEPPTEDTTVLEPPDPGTKPDAPEPVDAVLPDAGPYLASVFGVLEGGAETVPSDPTPYSVGLNQFARIKPIKTVNRLVNAEGTLKDARGVPVGWKPVDFVSNVTGWSWVNGVLRIDCASPSAARSGLESTSVPVNRAVDVLTVSGLMEMERHVVGEARISLYELRQDGSVVRETVAVSLASFGGMEEPVVFGPGYREWHASTASVKLVVGIAPDSSGTSNLRFTVRKLQLVGFPAALRRFEEGPKGAVGTFDTDATKALSAHSFWAVGPAPTPPGASLPEPEPARSIVGFDGGAFPAEWSRNANIVGEVVRGAAIHGPFGWRVAKTGGSYLGAAWMARHDPGLSREGAIRFLLRVAVRPTFGEVVLARIYAQGGATLAELVHRSDGTLWVHAARPELGRTVKRQATQPIADGSVLDLELSANGTGTRDGGVTLSYVPFSPGAPRTALYRSGGHDFRALPANTVQVGVASSTDARATFEYHFDQIVHSRYGDIIGRERPALPAGRTVPLHDAPLDANGLARLLDQDGSRKMQLYFFIAPGQGPASDPVRVPLLEEPLPVKPGLTHTIAPFGRWCVFTPEAAPGLRVTLVGPGLEPKEAGSCHGAGMAGVRGWDDDFLVFDVPPVFEDGKAYTGAKVELVMHDGVYVFQDFLFAEGALTTQEARDAMRGYARAKEGEFSVILPTLPEHDKGFSGGTWWARLGVQRAEGELAPGSTLALLFASSDSLDAAFLDESPDPLTVPPRRYARVSGRLTGNGRNSPVLPGGAVFLETWHPIGTLTRADGSEFPGAALVGNLVYPVSYPDEETERVGAETFVNELTDDIARVSGLKIFVSTEDTLIELQERCLRDEFRIEAVHSGNRVPGRALRIRFTERLKPDVKDFGSKVLEIEGVPRREIYATLSAEEVEVIEVAPLSGPRDVLLASESLMLPR